MTDKERIKEFILNNKEQFTKWGNAAAEKNLQNTMEANDLLARFCNALVSFINFLQEESKPKFNVGERIRKLHIGDKTGIKIKDICSDHYLCECNVLVYFTEQEDWEKVEMPSIVYVVTRCEEHSDYVEEVFFDEDKAKEYCIQFEDNEDAYARSITKIEVTL